MVFTVPRHRLSSTLEADVNPAETTQAAPSGSLAMTDIQTRERFDLIIVGGGPAALALLTRLLEDAPASLYTDQEHAMLVWLQHRPGASPALGAKGRGTQRKAATRDFSILVVDRIGEGWLGAWDRNFKELHIKHLRSPMFFHPCPADLDALLGYASAHGTPADLSEIPEVVGREQSKHQRKRKRAGKRCSGMALAPEAVINERAREDYFAPSTTLFRSFVRDECEKRYAASGVAGQWRDAQEVLGTDAPRGAVMLAKGEACRLAWDADERIFGLDVRAQNGEYFPLTARAVVYAGGNGGVPSIPEAIAAVSDDDVLNPLDECRPPNTSGPGWTHTFAMAGNPDFKFPLPPHGEGTGALIVVGGGLSSAQIVERALDEGWSHVVLLLRGYLKVKPFDIGLEWMGKYKNLHKMMFWQEPSPVDRLQRIRDARCGGSMPAYASRRLRALADAGRITLHTHTVISHAEYNDTASQWKLELRTSTPDGCTSSQDLEAQHIFLATGVILKFPFADAPGLPPRPLYGGLPALTEDLQWAADVPLFAVGPYCALQVGPAAFNLGGMREAADRVATRLAELGVGEREQEGDGLGGNQHRIANWSHNGFEVLVEASA